MRLDTLFLISIALLSIAIWLGFSVGAGPPAAVPVTPESKTFRARRASTVWWLTASLGVILPWGTALAVRTWLDIQGKPVMQWAQVLRALPVLLGLLIVFALPHVALASWGRRVVLRHFVAEKRSDVVALLGLGGAFVALSVATVWVHWSLWQNVDELFDVLVLAPFVVPLVLVISTTVGLLCGYAIGFIIAVTKHYPTVGTPLGANKT